MGNGTPKIFSYSHSKKQKWKELQTNELCHFELIYFENGTQTHSRWIKSRTKTHICTPWNRAAQNCLFLWCKIDNYNFCKANEHGMMAKIQQSWYTKCCFCVYVFVRVWFFFADATAPHIRFVMHCYKWDKMDMKNERKKQQYMNRLVCAWNMKRFSLALRNFHCYWWCCCSCCRYCCCWWWCFWCFFYIVCELTSIKNKETLSNVHTYRDGHAYFDVETHTYKNGRNHTRTYLRFRAFFLVELVRCSGTERMNKVNTMNQLCNYCWRAFYSFFDCFEFRTLWLWHMN